MILKICRYIPAILSTLMMVIYAITDYKYDFTGIVATWLLGIQILDAQYDR